MNRTSTINAATRNRLAQALGAMNRLGITEEASTVLAILLAQTSDSHEAALPRLLDLAYSTPSLDEKTRQACEDAAAFVAIAMPDKAFRDVLVRKWSEGGAA